MAVQELNEYGEILCHLCSAPAAIRQRHLGFPHLADVPFCAPCWFRWTEGK